MQQYPPLLTLTLPSDYDIHYQGWFIGGIFVILSFPISLYEVRVAVAMHSSSPKPLSFSSLGRYAYRTLHKGGTFVRLHNPTYACTLFSLMRFLSILLTLVLDSPTSATLAKTHCQNSLDGPHLWNRCMARLAV